MAVETVITAYCTRCMRTREIKFLKRVTNRKGKKVWRCRARSVCASIGRRKRAIPGMKDGSV